MVAVSSRFWIISLSNIMRHRSRDSIYSEYYDLRRARAVVICNQIRYWFGVFLSLGTISKKLSSLIRTSCMHNICVHSLWIDQQKPTEVLGMGFPLYIRCWLHYSWGTSPTVLDNYNFGSRLSSRFLRRLQELLVVLSLPVYQGYSPLIS